MKRVSVALSLLFVSLLAIGAATNVLRWPIEDVITLGLEGGVRAVEKQFIDGIRIPEKSNVEFRGYASTANVEVYVAYCLRLYEGA